ncbi:hypothetical protein IEN85_21615 [Pelagicoccus sp. NFK12]|uniref:Lipoprotein SmpA/OmlA domain-containing protein n=1 Tax=Pelagicoccus enzymogenes TaxID=2773457 RepID=A0A927FCZ7_9BACT|nr:hypothetical protein [Pelagicoccus enzymogenes]MBD5782111.1 hypothetical protein [Pelagicoccus enzymogenes]
MLRKLPQILCFATLPFASLNLRADDKIDQVLSELQALRQQVATLEARVATLEATKAIPAGALDASAPEAQPRERKNLFDHMRIELQKAEARASGPWTTPANWNGIQNGLTEDEVIEILGEPTDRKFSVRRDTDEIFYYRGDLEGTGEPIEGEIRIYKGKVRRFTLPDFPTES